MPVVAIVGASAGGYVYITQQAGDLLERNDDRIVYQIPAWIVAITLVRAVAMYAQALLTSEIAQRVLRDLQGEMFAAIVRADYARFSREGTGGLVSRFTYDINSQWALTGGMRAYHYDNTVDGFAGFGATFPTAESPWTGESICFTPIDATNPYLPCKNLLNRGAKSGETHRVNVTYKIDDDRMVYATMSTGFRPGGVNRLLSVPPYNPDFLTNYELGTKTTWLDHRLRINGAVFMERWTDAQFA
ncbi:MAG: hypothetical protein EBZ50_16435, partial [Alphaproteobacteria bacterium]|nr:hypothetical protein [Alphaproteobacteria bacterium]